MGSSADGPTLLNLPYEILEQLLLVLPLADRLCLSQTCFALHNIYTDSAALQYLAALQTSAYVDYPYMNSAPAGATLPESPGSVSPSFARADTDDPAIGFRSPHTGKLRPTIPSVSLAPWPKRRPEGSPCGYATGAAEKCRRLRDREKRWETMDAREKRVFKVQGREGVYELQEGIFLLCNDAGEDDDEKPQTIRLIPLPSATDPDLEDPPIVTKSHRFPVPISDLTMDPSQDLIVVSEFNPRAIDRSRPRPTHRYHLLSMSTFKPHPLACLATLDFPPITDRLPRSRQLLQVMGDTLAVLVAKYIPQWVFEVLHLIPGAHSQEEELVIWNWKTGRVLSRLPFPNKDWFSSFALLSPTTFMVTTTSLTLPAASPRPSDKMPRIQVYSILCDPAHTIVPAQPLDSEVMDDTTPRPVLVAVLGMPELQEGIDVISFDVRPDPPYPPRKASSAGEPTLVRHKAFTQDPAKGVLVFEYRMMETIVTGANTLDVVCNYPFEMFVLRETVVQIGKEGEDRLRMTWEKPSGGLGVRGVQYDYAWKDWGEEGARMMDKVMATRSWVCSCSGYRYISIIPHTKSPFFKYYDQDMDPDPETAGLEATFPYPPERSHLMLMDFSPYAVSGELARHSPYPESDDVDGARENKSFGTTFVPPLMEGEGWKARAVTEPTVIAKRSIWAEDVTSRLPYREIWREYGGLANGVMIDDQRVIVVNTNARRNGDWSTIVQEMTVLCM